MILLLQRSVSGQTVVPWIGSFYAKGAGPMVEDHRAALPCA
jgi:hypothetical protein